MYSLSFHQMYPFEVPLQLVQIESASKKLPCAPHRHLIFRCSPSSSHFRACAPHARSSGACFPEKKACPLAINQLTKEISNHNIVNKFSCVCTVKTS
jgi:hypothetical protein